MVHRALLHHLTWYFRKQVLPTWRRWNFSQKSSPSRLRTSASRNVIQQPTSDPRHGIYRSRRISKSSSLDEHKSLLENYTLDPLTNKLFFYRNMWGHSSQYFAVREGSFCLIVSLQSANKWTQNTRGRNQKTNEGTPAWNVVY